VNAKLDACRDKKIAYKIRNHTFSTKIGENEIIKALAGYETLAYETRRSVKVLLVTIVFGILNGQIKNIIIHMI
jgi:hypothetical protein